MEFIIIFIQLMKQNKENDTLVVRRESLKAVEAEKQLERANETIKRLEAEMKNIRRCLSNEQKDSKIIEEDQAAILTKAEQERTQMVRTYQHQISELKGKLETEGLVWIQRFDIRKTEYQAESARIRTEGQQEVREAKERYQQMSLQLKDQLEQEYKAKADFCKSESQRAVKQSETKVLELSLEFGRLQETLRDAHRKEILDIQKKQAAQICRLNKSHQLVLSSVKSEVRSEENMHRDTRAKMEGQKEQYLRQIEVLKQQNDKTQEEILVLKTQITDLSLKLEEQQSSNQRDNQDWQKKIEAEQESYESHIQELGARHQENATTILKNHYSYVQRLEQNLKILEVRHSEQKDLHATQIQQIKHCYQQRPSREEDIQSMSSIQGLLAKKTKEIQILKNDLKWCRLQLDNKEQTYNRIFAIGQRPLILPVHQRERKIKRFANSINHREVKSSKVIVSTKF